MALIAFTSFFLFIAWFLYACKLILLTGGNGRTIDGLSLDPHAQAKALHQTYELVTYIYRNGGEFHTEGEASLEHFMIHIYYRALRSIYPICLFLPNKFSEVILTEMSAIVNYLAESFGQQFSTN